MRLTTTDEIDGELRRRTNRARQRDVRSALRALNAPLQQRGIFLVLCKANFFVVRLTEMGILQLDFVGVGVGLLGSITHRADRPTAVEWIGREADRFAGRSWALHVVVEAARQRDSASTGCAFHCAVF